MAEPSREQTGVLVLRAWVESQTDDRFRARVTTRLNVESGEDRTYTAASVEGVLEIVRLWLKAFTTGRP